MLTVTKINSLKAKEKSYSITDGDGLSIEIPPKGKFRWRFRYRFDNKAKKVSLGTYPDVTLADARIKRADARNKIANSIDPFGKKVVHPSDEVVHKTFKYWAEWYKGEIHDLSDSHIKRVNGTLNKDIYPIIGDTLINDIKARDIIGIMHTMKKRGAVESARKTFSVINRIFKKAISNYPDDIERNPTADIDLTEVIGKKQTVSYPVITDPKELGILLTTISEYGLHEDNDSGEHTLRGHSSTRLALMMLAHVFTRPSVVRLATWDEVDLKTKQWVIPASKMKTKNELIVPLSKQVISILEEAKEISPNSSLIFPSNRSQISPMSDTAMVGALRRMEYDRTEIVAHSFRGIFSTIAHEDGTYGHDVIETQLAHSVGSAVSQAYNRALYLKERTDMMQWYSDLLEGYQNGNK